VQEASPTGRYVFKFRNTKFDLKFTSSDQVLNSRVAVLFT